MTRLYSGTATVNNGLTVVTIASGAPLSSANAPEDAPVFLNGVGYHIASRIDTTSFNLSRAYTGTNGTVSIEIDPLTPDSISVVNLARLVADVQNQINILDKNSQGLFYTRLGVTGDADPGPGNLAFNSSIPTSATEIYVDNIDANDRTVNGLIELWAAGTVILIRSLETTAYIAYRLPNGIELTSAYYKGLLQYVDHDGVLADGESVSVGWFRVGEGLEIDATGTFAGRAAYDNAAAGFMYLSSNGNGTTVTNAALFRKNSATSGDWGPAIAIQGVQGYTGWSPRFAVVADGTRRVLQLVGYIGGQGTAPTENVGQYVSTGGYTPTIGNATDIRGASGTEGLSAYQVAVANGFVGSQSAWLSSLVGLSAYQIAVSLGFSGTESAWILSLQGANGTDPGIFFTWDDSTVDSNPGNGRIRSNSGTVSSATTLFVSKINRNGNSVATFLSNLASSDSDRKGIITLTKSGSTLQAVFDVTSLTDATNYVKITVANGSGNLGFTLNDAVSLQFSPAGDRGTNGDGAGDVLGPSASVTDELALYDGTSGKFLKRSNLLLTALVQTSNNGSDFTDKRQTLDNLTLKGTAIASAASINLNNATGHFVDVSGTVTTTAISLNAGAFRFVRALAAWPITGGANLVFANTTGTSYTATAGDIILFIGDASSVVRAMVFPAGGIAANGVVTAKIANSAVTNAKQANMTAGTFKGRITASTGAPEDMTATQATSLLNVFGADSGSGGLKGLVPATAAGDANKFLRGDGTWAGASGVPVGTIVFSPNSTILPGFLAAEGGTFSSTTYPELFAFLGSTTLPDMRDRVARGAGTNAGAAGTTQEDALQGHAHYYGTGGRGDGSSLTAGGTTYAIPWAATAGASIKTAGILTDDTNGTPRIASETRVKAYVGRYLIKAFDSVVNPGVVDLTALATEVSKTLHVATPQVLTQAEKGQVAVNSGQYWETIGAPINLTSAVAAVTWTDLSAYSMLRITGWALPSSDGVLLYAQLSSNNGSSFISGANDYGGQYLRASSTTVAGGFGTFPGLLLSPQSVGYETSEGAQFVVTISNFNSTFHTTCISSAGALDNAGALYSGHIFSKYSSLTAMNSLRIIYASSNIFRGSFILEGLRG